MSYSLSVSGHVNEAETPEAPSAAEVEAELSVALHELLSQPKYGCGSATFYGQHIGSVDLLAAAKPESSDGDS
jgi:hypothetical protein